MSKEKMSDKPINGVRCSVSNCNYHTLDDECLAESIHVDVCRDDDPSHETDCKTFLKKDNFSSSCCSDCGCGCQ